MADMYFGLHVIYEFLLQVIQWQKYLHIPHIPQIGHSTADLIRKLCCGAESRLGSQNGAQDIKAHPFFNGTVFNPGMRKQPVPPGAMPKIAHPEDTSNFEEIDSDRLMNNSDDDENTDMNHENGRAMDGSSRGNNLHSNKDYHGFYEFTFRRFFDDGGHPLPETHPSFSQMNQTHNSHEPINQRRNDSPPPPPVYV